MSDKNKVVFTDDECSKRFEAYLIIRNLVMESNKAFSSKNVDYPKFPCSLSESLVARSLANNEVAKKFGPFENIERRHHPDIVADGYDFGAKGTVMKTGGWVSYTDDDKNCDALIWLDFYPLVVENKNCIPATTFYNPSEHIPSNLIRVTYSDVCNHYEGSDDIEVAVSITFTGYTDGPIGISFVDFREKIWDKFYV